MTFAYNPFTDNLDYRLDTNGIAPFTTLTANDGNVIDGPNANILGYPTSAPLNTYTFISGGNFYIEQARWITPFIVDPSSTLGLRGTYTTIQAAVTAATTNAIIFIRSGTYTENVVMSTSLSLVNFSALQGATQRVKIVGKVSDGGSVISCQFSGIQFQTNSDYCFELTAASNVVFNNCIFAGNNFTPLHFTSGSCNVFMYNTNVNLNTTGLALYNMAAGSIRAYNCQFTNSGASTTATTQAAGSLRLVSSYCECVLACTQGTFSIYDTVLDTSGVNTACITTAGTGTHVIDNCSLSSGTASCVSVGSGTSVTVSSCTLKSSNTNVLTGIGTLNYGGNTFTGTSSLINTTNKTLQFSDGFRSTMQPAVQSYLSAIQSNVTGDGTVYTLICDTEVGDQSSSYDNTTGIFTAPYAGFYLFCGHITLQGVTAANTTNLANLITTGRNYRLFDMTGIVTSGVLSFSYALIVKMAATNTAKIQITSAGSTKTVNVYGDATDSLTAFDVYALC